MRSRGLVLAVFAIAVAVQFGHAADQCHTCENQPSNADCTRNGAVRTCSDGPTNGCQTEVRVNQDGTKRITKKCKSLPVCQSEALQFASQCTGLSTSGSICYFCCTDNLCNSCVSNDGRCGAASSESTGKSSTKSCSCKSKSTGSKSTAKSSKSTAKSSKSTAKSSKSSTKNSKSNCSGKSKSKESCENDTDEDDQGQDDEDDQGQDDEDDQGQGGEDDQGGKAGEDDVEANDGSSECTCEDDSDDDSEDDQGGVSGIYAGFVTWIVALVTILLR